PINGWGSFSHEGSFRIKKIENSSKYRRVSLKRVVARVAISATYTLEEGSLSDHAFHTPRRSIWSCAKGVRFGSSSANPSKVTATVVEEPYERESWRLAFNGRA